MNRLLFVLAAIVAVAAARTLPSEFVEWEGRIIGGSVVSGRAYPHQVSLTSALLRLHFCGGGIISPRWVLSAAHCTVGRRTTNTAIWAGTNSRIIGGIRFGVSRVINHGSYNPDTLVNDISLLESSTVMSGTGIASRGLSSEFVGVNTAVHISGWGQTSYPLGLPAANLMWLDQTVLSNADCRARLGTTGTIVNSKICAFSGRNGTGTCMGDSGGPLVLADSQTIVGVVSWDNNCASGLPDVYTRVSSFRIWISSNTGV